MKRKNRSDIIKLYFISLLFFILFFLGILNPLLCVSLFLVVVLIDVFEI